MFTTLAGFLLEKYKHSKQEAGYVTHTVKGQRCDECTMWRAPNKCSAVAGDIKPEAWCKWWKKSKRKNLTEALAGATPEQKKEIIDNTNNNISTSGGVLPWKDVPQEEKNKAYELLKAHNDAVVNPQNGPENYYFIDVTGKHQVYYTFWRFRILPAAIRNWIKNPIYFGNLSTDIVSSVQKALSKNVVKNVRVELYGDETREHLIGRTKATPKFTFGKYRGQTFPDVYLNDPGYFAFLAKNADPKYAQTENAQAIQAFAQMYFDDVTKKNIETSTAQFVGKPGDRYEGELELYSFKEVPGSDVSAGYNVYKLKDAQGNKFITYKFPTNDVGTKMKIKAKIKDHKEILGVKFNKIGYVKPV